MSKIIIYDNKNILVADLDRTETIKERNEAEISVNSYEYLAIFKEYKIINSNSLRKQLKRIEKIFKYHKSKKKTKE